MQLGLCFNSLEWDAGQYQVPGSFQLWSFASDCKSCIKSWTKSWRKCWWFRYVIACMGQVHAPVYLNFHESLGCWQRCQAICSFEDEGFYICFFISSSLKNSYRHCLLPSFVFLLFIVLTLAIMKLLIVYCVIYWLLQSSCLATNSYSTKNSERSWRRQGKLNRNGCCGWRSKCPDISFTRHLR